MAKPPSSPGLAELIDLEFALSEVQDHSAAARAAGDSCCEELNLDPAAARRRAETDCGFRQQLALAWLSRLRQGGVALPGALLTRSLHAASRLLFLIAVMGGVVTASTTLRYDGSAPVNLWAFLAVFVLLQFVLLLATLILALRRLGPNSLTAGPIGGWVERVAGHPWLQRVLALPESETRAAWSKLRERRQSIERSHVLYAQTESWMLIRFSQAAGVLFHVAAAFTFLAVVLFSDLSFGWSTTPAGIDPAWLHGLAETLAMPWAWLFPDAAPSLEQVSLTQWNRLDSAFVAQDQAAASAAAAAWWSFLLAAQLCWGLLPRLLTLGFARWRSRKLERNFAFDHAGFHELFDAMLVQGRKHAAPWSGPAPQEVQGELVERGPAATASTISPPTPARGVIAIAWGAFPADFQAVAERLEQYFGWRVERASKPAMVGGSDAEESTAALARAITRAQAIDHPCIALYAEAAEAPNKALLRTLAQLRAELAAEATLAVVLLGHPDEETTALWRGYLARAADPRLRVEVLP